MTSFLRALPRLLDPDPEADPMEQELTREQVEAMDETMTFNTRRVTQLHRRNELNQHFFAPGSIEKHGRVTWVDVALVLLAYVAGAALLAACLAFGAWLAGALIGWLSTIDLSALTHLVGKS